MSNPRTADPGSRRVHGWLLVALLTAGCGAGRDGTGRRIAQRFLVDEPGALFVAREQLPMTSAARWSFEDPAQAAGWDQSPPEPAGQFRNGTCRGLARASGPWQLSRPLKLDADRVQAIRVRIDGLRKGTVTLSWAGTGEALSDERLLRLKSRDGAPSLSFETLGHPAWTGEIGRLHLAITPKQRSRGMLCLREIEALRFEPDAETLSSILARSWKVESAAEIRNGRLSLPGVPIEWPVEEVPAAGRLAFSYGLQRGVRRPVLFRVLARSAGGTESVLFEDEISEGEPGAWREGRADLSDRAGESLHLVFETVAAGERDPAHGFALWANPELHARGGEDPRPDIVLISIDTLRADRLSLYGHSRPTSPNIDAWARRTGVVFRNAVAPSPWTLPSHVSMLTGLDALRHGVNHSMPAGNELVTLAEVLRDAGYATYAATGGGWMSSRQGLTQGFDAYRPWPPRGQGEELAGGLARALAILDRPAGKPLFLFLHTYAVHEPYRPREPYFSSFYGAPVSEDLTVITRTRPGGGETGFVGVKEFLTIEGDERPLPATDFDLISALYDSGVRHMDEQLGALLARLGRADLAGRTAVILTSDHGEALGEKKLGGHAYLYDFNLKVPLILALPGGEHAGTFVDEQVRVIDVFPTLLELAGLSPPRPVDGESLVGAITGVPRERPAWSYAASSNFGLSLRLDNRLKYIYNNTAWQPVRGAEEVYDLRRDALESHDLAGTSAELESLRRRVEDVLLERGRGVRIHLENGSAASLDGEISGEMLKPRTVKSRILPEASDLRWEGGKGVRFTVGAGEGFTLFIEGEAVGDLRFSGWLEGAEELVEKVSLPELEVPWRRVLDGREWGAAAEPPGSGATSITVTWHGPAREAAERGRDLTAADAALAEQLKALGYVD